MPHEYEVLDHRLRFEGSFFSLYSDQVAMPGGGSAERDYIRHKGAVAVLAVDDDGRVVLISQYRHGVRRHLWELPAGARDEAGEDPAAAAARELAEETDLRAGSLSPLASVDVSPGVSDEHVEIFLGRQLAEVPEAQRHRRTQEEADIIVRRFPLEEAVAMVLRGEISNAVAMIGILAYAAEKR